VGPVLKACIGLARVLGRAWETQQCIAARICECSLTHSRDEKAALAQSGPPLHDILICMPAGKHAHSLAGFKILRAPCLLAPPRAQFDQHATQHIMCSLISTPPRMPETHVSCMRRVSSNGKFRISSLSSMPRMTSRRYLSMIQHVPQFLLSSAKVIVFCAVFIKF
jgi:hypothetical protein